MIDQTLTNQTLISQIEQLHQEIRGLRDDRSDLEILVETITEHSTDLENEIYEKNQTMLKYLHQVEKITAAAAEVEKGTFIISSLDDVAARSDELGQLARIFQAMVQQVKVREEKLKQQVEELRIEIDQAKQERQVAEIVGTDSFKNLKEKLKRLKKTREENS